MKILLVEDNETIVKGLVYLLGQNGYETRVCETCEAALLAASQDYDLLLLDVGLSDGNGFELYEELRRFTKAPAIFLTAYDDEDHIVNGFQLGAEDYITKPFLPRELLARIKRATRGKEDNPILEIEDLQVDLSNKSIKRDKKIIELTALEYRIFFMLVQNRGNVVTRELILEKIWDLAGNYVNDNTLTVYIKRIREKLGIHSIKTVKGLGYRLEDK